MLGLRPEHERLRPHGGWQTRIEQRLDPRSRLWNVAGFHQVAGTYERSAHAFRLAFRRREAHGLGRNIAAASGAPRSAAASAARSTTAAIPSSGVDVASARCRASCSRSSTSFGRLQVHGAAPSGGHVEVHGCSEQGVREADDSVGADRDRPGCGGFVHESVGAGLAERLHEHGRRRALDRRDQLEERPRVSRECSHAFGDDLLERRRDRQLRLQIRWLPLDRPRELECEHRVASGRGVYGGDLGAGEAHGEALAEEPLEVLHGERPDREFGECLRLERVSES